MNYITAYKFDAGECATTKTRRRVRRERKVGKEEGRKGDRYSVIKCSTIHKNCPFTSSIEQPLTRTTTTTTTRTTTPTKGISLYVHPRLTRHLTVSSFI